MLSKDLGLDRRAARAQRQEPVADQDFITDSGFADAPDIKPIATNPRQAQPPPVRPPPAMQPLPSMPEGSRPTIERPVLERTPTPAPAPLPVSSPAPRRAVEEPVSSGVREIRAVPAPLWRRTIASLVDLSLVLALVGLYLLIATAIVGTEGLSTKLEGLDGLVARLQALERVLIPGVFLGAIVALLYSAIISVLWNGRTVGRRLVGIVLVDSSGLAPTPTKVAVRAALSLVSFAFFLAGFWLVLFDRKGQSFHDKVTSTFIVLPT